MRNDKYIHKINFYLLRYGKAKDHNEISKSYGEGRIAYRYLEALKYLITIKEIERSKDGFIRRLPKNKAVRLGGVDTSISKNHYT